MVNRIKCTFMHSTSLPPKPVLFDRQLCPTLSWGALTSAKSMGEFRIGIIPPAPAKKIKQAQHWASLFHQKGITELLFPTRRDSFSLIPWSHPEALWQFEAAELRQVGMLPVQGPAAAPGTGNSHLGAQSLSRWASHWCSLQGSTEDEVLWAGFIRPVLLVDLQPLMCCESAMDPTVLWLPAWKPHRTMCLNSGRWMFSLEPFQVPVYKKISESTGVSQEPLLLLVCSWLHSAWLGCPSSSSSSSFFLEPCASIQGQLMVPKVTKNPELKKHKHEIYKKLKKEDMENKPEKWN